MTYSINTARTEELRWELEARFACNFAVERVWMGNGIGYGYRAYRTDVRDSRDITMSNLDSLRTEVITQMHRNSFRA